MILTMDGAPAAAILTKWESALLADYAETRPPDGARRWLLTFIEEALRTAGLTPEQFGLPSAGCASTELEQEGRRWDAPQCRQRAITMATTLSEEQRAVYDEIMRMATGGYSPVPLVISGRAGRGKTYLLQCVVCALRGEELVVLPSATTALAATNYDGGFTAHALFQIPVVTDDSSTEPLICKVSPRSQRAELIRGAAVIIWDEIFNARRQDFEAMEQLLRELGHHDVPFGGKVVVIAGDPRQIPPVVKSNNKEDVLANSVTSSPSWTHVRVMQLTLPQRDAADPQFSRFVDAVGDGATEVDAEGRVALEKLLVVTSAKDALTAFLKSSGATIGTSSSICCLTNSAVDEHNAAVLNKMQGKLLEFYSFNQMSSEDVGSHHRGLLSTDFMSQINQPGVPPHILRLKIGCVCTVERNLLLTEKVAHNTKVILEKVAKHYLEVLDPATKRHHLIPRITFMVRLPKTSLTFTRRQYPLRLAYAVTVNKSQGQTLSMSVVDLRTDPFAHGQLYVALSRVKCRKDILVLSSPEDVHQRTAHTTNVVYKELLHALEPGFSAPVQQRGSRPRGQRAVPSVGGLPPQSAVPSAGGEQAMPPQAALTTSGPDQARRARRAVVAARVEGLEESVSAWKKVHGDGRCLFRALVRLMDTDDVAVELSVDGRPRDANLERSERRAADQLRHTVCNWMEQHNDVLRVGSGTAQHPAPVIEAGQSIDEYIEGMRYSASWAGEPELIAATEVLGRSIRVWKREQNTFLQIREYHAAVVGLPPLDVIWADGNHYNIFLPHVAFPESF